MDNNVVRRGGLRDISRILEIEQESFGPDSFSAAQFTYLINHSKGAFLVVENGGRILAYLSLLFHSRYNYLRIYSVAVSAQSRGKGIGQLLMDEAFKIASDSGAKKITLEVMVTNRSAIALYLKNGFKKCGIKPGYYHHGEDAFYMQRDMLTANDA
ncbi:MAG: ribosomal protein S18-alanine N-acetyltransferase [Bacteroidaceae bacterium]|nr:ribosomal protein S18-alanine N-acetyltransferase [Bacteroidaceae bacterium]